LAIDCRIAAVRDREAEIANFVYTGRDITAERTLEPELAHARNLQSVATLAGGAAHDFNNLLMVISAYAELALRNLYNEHPLRRNLQEILAASRRASELTGQVLGVGRRQTRRPEQLSINSVVEEVSRMLTKLLGEDVELQLSLQEGLGAVTADSGQLEQVLLNLAVNARDAMPDGGKLVIQTTPVPVSESDLADVTPGKIHELVELAVCDSGHGIPEEQLSRIFDPFFTTKPEGQGTGLGLAIVDSIVRQNGGFIRVESSPDHGTTFRIYLPVAPEQDRKPELLSFSEVVPGSGTVLVVEDDHSVLKATVEFLSSIGYYVLSAANGVEALRLMESHSGPIDLMLTDVVMPAMNGTKLASLVSSRRPEMRVLFVSGHAESALVRKGLTDFNTHFLEKPCSFESLSTKIRQVLETPVPERAAAAGAS
jgi:two-component system cell cycle sensor histidine kinase/response regulator CckA